MGVLIGFGLIVGASILIFWNEGRAVQTARSLTEGEGLVIAVDQAKVDPANEGKLVHISGDLATKLPLTDPEFGISTSAARLVRTVEVYQWKEESRTETKKNLGGSEDKVTTYTYTQAWSEPRIDSSRFHEPGGHENPQQRYRRLEVAARDATLGAFRPGEAVLRRLATDEDYRIDPATAGTLRDRFGQATVADGRIYVGLDPARPRLGDTRVSYRIARVGPVSLIGRQSGTDFNEFPTKAGDRLLMASTGTVSANDMFKAAEAENRLLTWILRGVGSVLMLVGFALIGGPLSVVGSIVPFIGDVLARRRRADRAADDRHRGADRDRDRVVLVPAAGVDRGAGGRIRDRDAPQDGRRATRRREDHATGLIGPDAVILRGWLSQVRPDRLAA